jgi:two-component system chemotaxis response regulator CheY
MAEKTAVLVDDSVYILKQLKEFFESKLYFAVLATGVDGIEAVQLYRKHQPDLMTLDITMPQKNGIDAAREIIREFPRARLLMVTAVRGEEAMGYQSFGAQGIIFKPLRLGDADYVKNFAKIVDQIVSPRK